MLSLYGRIQVSENLYPRIFHAVIVIRLKSLDVFRENSSIIDVWQDYASFRSMHLVKLVYTEAKCLRQRDLIWSLYYSLLLILIEDVRESTLFDFFHLFHLQEKYKY